MKILVTGAAGFMGSHLVEQLSKEGHTVVGLDNYSTGFLGNIQGTTLEIDLLDKELVDEILEKGNYDLVYHLAAWAHEGLSQFAPMKITENNYNATLNILTSAIKHKVKKFIFTSSMSVYGDQTPPFDEEMDRAPADIYGIAKTASESALEVLSTVHGIDWTIIRPHNVYGERQNLSDPYRNVVGIFIRRALEGKPLIVYGDGEQTRAFSYIDDVTPAIAKAGFTASGEIINVGPTKNYSINELAQTIAQIHEIETGKKIDIEHVPDRPLEVVHAYCTHGKAEQLLDYKTSISFYDGLTKMYRWATLLKENAGIAEPKYLDELEIVSKDTPKTWTQKSL